jgi:molybdopterin-guanine dinucleotide biosynthesis protein A
MKTCITYINVNGIILAVKRSGYVLVGGRSSRMGRDKALLFGKDVAREVELATGNVTLVGNPDLRVTLGYPCIPDLYPGEGPVGGILTALHYTSAEWNLVVACDMPGLSADFLRELLQAAEERDADALLPMGPSGYQEPLCAVYHRRAMLQIEANFTRGIRKVTAALEGLLTASFAVAEVSRFQNVNTPEDWAPYGR